MRFVKLTDLHNSDKPIYLNSDQIVALRRIGDATWVHTPAHFKPDAVGTFMVAETPEAIVSLISKI